MKIAITLASLFSALTIGQACAQVPPLSYQDVVREARRYEKLEGPERAASPKILFKQVKLNLKPFGGGSPDYFVTKKDEIGFICAKNAPGFKGGTVVATIVKHEEAEGASHFYTLDNCTSTK